MNGTHRVEFKALGSIILIEFTGTPVVTPYYGVTETGQELECRPGAFRDHFMQLLENGTRRFVVNISRYTFDTMFAGELVAMYKRITQHDGWFGIVKGNTHDALFATMKLDTVFLFFDDQKDAIASAEAWRPHGNG